MLAKCQYTAPLENRAARKARELGLQVELRVGSAEQLPFADASFDTVVFTLSLCTIPNVDRALSEASRVLGAEGTLLALEHVRAAEPGLARWQDRLNPLWRAANSGCNLNRQTGRSIELAGFEFESREDWLEPRIPVPLVRPLLAAVGRKPGGRQTSSSKAADRSPAETPLRRPANG